MLQSSKILSDFYQKRLLLIINDLKKNKTIINDDTPLDYEKLITFVLVTARDIPGILDSRFPNNYALIDFLENCIHHSNTLEYKATYGRKG